MPSRAAPPTAQVCRSHTLQSEGNGASVPPGVWYCLLGAAPASVQADGVLMGHWDASSCCDPSWLDRPSCQDGLPFRPASPGRRARVWGVEGNGDDRAPGAQCPHLPGPPGRGQVGAYPAAPREAGAECPPSLLNLRPDFCLRSGFPVGQTPYPSLLGVRSPAQLCPGQCLPESSSGLFSTNSKLDPVGAGLPLLRCLVRAFISAPVSAATSPSQGLQVPLGLPTHCHRDRVPSLAHLRRPPCRIGDAGF